MRDNPLLRAMFGPLRATLGPQRVAASDDVIDLGAYQNREGEPIVAYHPSTRALDVNADALMLGGISVAPQVFEVTDLTILAGTDWSAVPHSLGSFEVPFGTAVVPVLLLQVAEPIVDKCSISATGIGDYVAVDASGTLLSWSPVVSQSQPPVVIAGEQDQNPFNPPPDSVVIEPSLAAHAVDEVGNPAGPTTADIYVVRGLAAFLVI